MTEVLIKMITTKVGKYASAKRIQEVFGISLSFVYLLLENEKIKTREKYGRKEIELESFLRVLSLGTNVKIQENLYTKQDFDINNFYNWGAKNEIERYLENIFQDELGHFTSVRDLVKLTGISKSTWHELMNEGKIMYFNINSRKLIITKSLLPYFREARKEKDE